MRNTKFRVLTLLTGLTLIALCAACSSPTPAAPPTPTTAALGGAPVVIINSPPSNSDFEQGDAVKINSTSTSRNGIVLVELIVDGRVVQSSPTPNDQPQVSFSVIQNWQATAGQHNILVRATDARANTGDSQIQVDVSGSAQPTAAIPTAAIPTAVPPTTAPVTAVPSCTLNSTFVSDVTFPDGTAIAPNSPFVKTWAIKNSGTCEWGPGFNIVFLSGTQMGAPSPSPIPPAAPGETINVSLNMVSPAAPGNYAGLWQLQASNGALFGTKVDVAIVVPGGPPPTSAAPTPPPAACSGTPQITSFVANPGTIQQGQFSTISWGQVLNATNVSLNTPQGSSGVATPGQIQVQPGSTTTYTLIAYCYNNSVQAQTTVNVQGAPPPPTPPPSQPDQIQSIQVQKSGDNYKVTVQYFWSGNDAPAVMRAVGVSSGADPVTNTGQASIEPNHVKYVIINLTGKNAATIDVCMQGHNGQDLACGSQPVR